MGKKWRRKKEKEKRDRTFCWTFAGFQDTDRTLRKHIACVWQRTSTKTQQYQKQYSFLHKWKNHLSKYVRKFSLFYIAYCLMYFSFWVFFLFIFFLLSSMKEKLLYMEIYHVNKQQNVHIYGIPLLMVQKPLPDNQIQAFFAKIK